jgi:hypothetical protein
MDGQIREHLTQNIRDRGEVALVLVNGPKGSSKPTKGTAGVHKRLVRGEHP